MQCAGWISVYLVSIFLLFYNMLFTLPVAALQLMACFNVASARGPAHTSWREITHCETSCSKKPTELAPMRIRLGNVASKRGDFGFNMSYNLERLIPSILTTSLQRITLMDMALPPSLCPVQPLYFLQKRPSQTTPFSAVLVLFTHLLYHLKISAGEPDLLHW